MYHIFLIHSSAKGHLGCFQILAVTNNAAMNAVEGMSLCYNWASFGYIPKGVFLGLEEGCFLILWEITILKSKAAVPACTPTSNGRVFPLCHILSSMSCHQCFWSCLFWQVLLRLYLESDCLWQCIQVYFPLSLLWVSVCLVLCWGLWSIWT